MGADSFLSIGKWYRSSDLLVACDFIVASRPGFDLSRVAAALPPNISVASTDAQQGDNLVLSLRNAGHRESRLYLLPDLEEQASASGIRESLHHGVESRGNSIPEWLRISASTGCTKKTVSFEASAGATPKPQ